MILHVFPFLTKTFPITVDRIEENQAIVEWKDGSISSLPTYFFPIEVYEGQSWFLHIKKINQNKAVSMRQTTSHEAIRDLEWAQVVSNYPAYLYQHNAIISLPHPTVLSLGSAYHIYFSPIRGTYAQ